MRVLYVCTANICRSPSAEALLRDAVAEDDLLADVEVGSAGVHAVEGAPGCTIAPALEGRADEHRSRPLTADLIRVADLILTADREHRSAVIGLLLDARDRTLTIRQAGRLADWLVESGAVEAARRAAGSAAGGERGDVRGRGAGDRQADGATGDVSKGGLTPATRSELGDAETSDDLPGGVAPLPGDVDSRWRWIVDELDAARGLAPGPASAETPAAARPRWRRAREEADVLHPDDIPDPHVLGSAWHDAAFQQIRQATESLVRLFGQVMH